MSSYSDLTDAKRQLDLADANPDDAADIATLTEIDAEVSRTLELKTGRKWASPAAPSAKTVDSLADTWGDILLLPTPIRSATSVAIIGPAAETLTAYNASTGLGDYVLWLPDRNGDYRGLKRVQNGSWPPRNGIDRVTITGIWADEASGGTPPEEIVDAATFVTVETYRQRKSSPTGEIGPDGLTFRPRNPWGFEVVKEAIKKHSALTATVF